LKYKFLLEIGPCRSLGNSNLFHNHYQGYNVCIFHKVDNEILHSQYPFRVWEERKKIAEDLRKKSEKCLNEGYKVEMDYIIEKIKRFQSVEIFRYKKMSLRPCREKFRHNPSHDIFERAVFKTNPA